LHSPAPVVRRCRDSQATNIIAATIDSEPAGVAKV
jgi:hypothetical protein